MSSMISRFPGVGCRFFVRGRCLRSEVQNPGLEQSWRCEVLRALENAYDAFITQADTFNLTLDQASAIWEKRLDQLILAHPRCEAYIPVNEADIHEGDPEPLPFAASAANRAAAEREAEMVGCVLCWQGYCIAALPPCSGVCEEFCRREAE